MAAYAFPLSLTDFFDRLKISEFSFVLRAQHAATGLESGDILRAEIAPAMWQGDVALAPMPARSAAQIEALLALLERPGAGFLMTRPHQRGPASDPLGAALTGRTVTIASLNADNRRLSLAGLPAGFQISPGDLLSFTYGTGPVRQALHRVTDLGAVASGGGSTGLFEIGPHIRPGAQTGAVVTLVRPVCKAVLVPGSVAPGQGRGRITSGLSFSWRQAFR